MRRPDTTGKAKTKTADVLPFVKPGPTAPSNPSIPSSTASPSPSPKPSRADIDRLGEVNSIVDDYDVQVAPYKREQKLLETRINSALEQLAADEIYPDEGERYRMLVGQKSEQQKLKEGGLQRVLEFVGQDKFLAMCGVTFKDLERALSAEQYAEVVSKARTGGRTINIVPKAAPTPLKPAA